MKFICSQKKLSDNINIVQKAITNRTTHPILEGIFIKAKEGILKLIGNDLQMGIESFLEAEIIKEGSVVVPSRIFGDIVRKLPNAPIEIEVGDNYLITLKALNSEYNIQGLDPHEYPELNRIAESDIIEIEQGLFKGMIDKTIFAVATDETRPILTGALVEISKNNINLVCLDGYRLALRRDKIDNNLEKNVIIPGKTLTEIGRIMDYSDEKISISIDEKHILFDLGYTRVISRLLTGEFLNYNQIIPDEYNTRLKVDVKILHDAIERASLLAREGKNNLIKLTVKEDILIINSNSEVGRAHEEIPVIMEGKEMVIAFNARYFLDILRSLDEDEASINFTTNVSPCVFKPLEGDDFTYLLLPVRINA